MRIAVFRIVRFCPGLACALFLTFTALAQTTPPATAPATAPAAGQPQTNQQAQPPAAGDDQATNTLKVSVNEVYLEFVVSDKHGHFIRNLKQSDFALLDDHKAPAQVYSFTQETNLPLRVGILIDTSTSIRSRFQFEQQAATSFLLSILRPASDKAFVEGFDVAPDYRQDWTNDVDALTRGIDALRPGGGTALYDAVYSACRDKLLTARGQEPVRKAIVLVSDGDDNQSHAYLEDAIRECHRADTIIYAISTNVSPSRDRGDDVLEKMAIATGGKAFFPTSMDDMPVSFAAIQDELRSQYALVYKPADFKADGSFRPIYLFCLDRRYTVRVREGYFAPKG
ncbi:MAG TPA: VWA domain-containing protein [Acidobacteriaceae bacterium]|jgi:Ca-activated chloride channel homolog|nr:VWA domain-containing protein [Acidobacteriaceae bacterium]